MKQFVAMSDDMLYRADGLPGPLVPYQCGVFCWHQLRDEAMGPVSHAGSSNGSDVQRVTFNSSPALMPSLSATPALSSSTYCAGALEG
jgi:hypothetical protein